MTFIIIYNNNFINEANENIYPGKILYVTFWKNSDVMREPTLEFIDVIYQEELGSISEFDYFSNRNGCILERKQIYLLFI